MVSPLFCVFREQLYSVFAFYVIWRIYIIRRCSMLSYHVAHRHSFSSVCLVADTESYPTLQPAPFYYRITTCSQRHALVLHPLTTCFHHTTCYFLTYICLFFFFHSLCPRSTNSLPLVSIFRAHQKDQVVVTTCPVSLSIRLKTKPVTPSF